MKNHNVMKIDKVKKQLKKINNLFSTIDEEGQISTIERDLLRNYVMELYEKVVLDDSNVIENKPKKSSKKESKPKKTDDTESIFNSEVVAPVKTEPLEKVVERELQAVSNGSSPTLDVEAVIDIEEDHNDPDLNIIDISTEEQEKIDLIFTKEQSSDLSEKLGKLPITDLNKAIGLNEKIFTINELFKGNGSHYQEVMKELNELPTFDKAKEYLLKNVVNRYDWYMDKKVKKATNFVKVIQRRYL